MKRFNPSVIPVLCLFLLLTSGGCWSVAERKAVKAPQPDPQTERVRLDAAEGWEARLLWSGDCGVWTVELLDVIPQCAGAEVVALDDKGRCLLLSLNASKVSLWQPVMDGQWLGGVCHDNIDPARPGPELYVGGKRGNLYQVVPLPQGGFDANVIAHFPGKEIHTLVAADLDPDLQGNELYAGLITGELYRVDPYGSGKGFGWNTVLVHEDPGRIRDAVVMKAGEGKGPSIIYVSRSGRVVKLLPGLPRLEEKELYRCPQGLARIDRGKGLSLKDVLYVVGDDGQVMRLHKLEGGAWERELIYAGPVGARGIAAGRFDPDPRGETLALFGYSGEVEILQRTGPKTWTSETVFTDADKGHWLCTGDMDDRNSTDEIVISGYGKRVVMLSRN